MSIPSGYDQAPDFGLLYDAIPIYGARPDIAFYLGEAARDGGVRNTVLDLGCGTGRMLLQLARAGHVVTGIDSSASMLARCRAKLAAEPPDLVARVSLVQADVREFQAVLPRAEGAASAGFQVALAPFRVFQHLVTTSDQIRCLEAVRSHLAPGGRLAFDVFNPHFALMTVDRSQEVEDTAELPMADGRFLRRTVRVPRIRWVEQLSEVELIYYVRTGAVIERVVHAFRMRWYLPAELEHLLARSGFRVEAIHGDFDRNPLRDDSSEIVIVAARD